MRTVNLVFKRRGAFGWLLFPALVLTGLLAPQRTVKADPIAELRALSVFPNADLSKLAGGEILAARGPAMGSGRALSVESAYVLRLPIKSAVNFQQKWTPARHPELKVFYQGDLTGKGAAADFQRLASAPANSSVKNFVEATLKLPADSAKLQLSQAESKSFVPGGSTSGAMPQAVSDFWTRILLQRAQSFASGGLSGLAPYETAGSTIRVADEVAMLLRGSPKAQAQFSSLISSTPIGGGRGSSAGAFYWQLFDVDGTAAVTLGASYVKPAAAGFQLADLQYYASGGIYALVAFYQLWPVQINGQEATLVWRVDLTSASALGNLRGVERLGSGAAMMREVQKSVRALLKDVPAGS